MFVLRVHTTPLVFTPLESPLYPAGTAPAHLTVTLGHKAIGITASSLGWSHLAQQAPLGVAVFIIV